MTPSYFRIGGLMMDLPAGFERRCNQFMADFPEAMNTFETLVTGNTIWMSRTKGIGVIERDEAINWGLTGPCLRGQRRRAGSETAQSVFGLRDLRF
jgi:NADH-quinone oxidoreductase subunit D